MKTNFKIVVFLVVLLLICWILYVVPNRLTNTATMTNSLQTFYWEKISEHWILDSPPLTSLFFFDSSNGVALSIRTLESTSDGGKSWKPIFDFKDKGLSSLVFTSPEMGWVVGEEWANKNEQRDTPVILRTIDRGKSWEKVNFDGKSLKQVNEQFSTFDDICFQENGNAWIIGDGGIIESEFHENSVVALNLFKTKEKLYRIFCEDSGKIWAVGSEGVVAHYDQNRWNYQKLGDNKSFTKIIVNGNSVWLVGNSISTINESKESTVKGVLLRSKDNGLTWDDKTPTLVDGLVDIYFNNNTGWVIGLNGGIYSTINGGDSWVEQTSPTQSNLVSIFFYDPANGWISGDKGIILKFQQQKFRTVN